MVLRHLAADNPATAVVVRGLLYPEFSFSQTGIISGKFQVRRPKTGEHHSCGSKIEAIGRGRRVAAAIHTLENLRSAALGGSDYRGGDGRWRPFRSRRCK